MNKKYLNIALALTVTLAGVFASNLQANAETSTIEWDETYNGTGFTSTFESDKDTISGAMPGDTISFDVNYKNGSTKTSQFYLSTDVIKTLEEKDGESTGASGGAYTYVITSTIGDDTQILFDSKLVGGDYEDVVGLNQVDSQENEFLVLGELKSGESGVLKVEIVLDGNTQDNSYMSQLATLSLQLGALPTDLLNEKITRTVTNTVTKTNTVRGKGKITTVTIPSDQVPLSGGNPQTGDSILPLIICGLALLVGMMFIFWYFRLSKREQEA